MKPTTVLLSAPAVLGLLLLAGCAVQQPMARSGYAPVQNERPVSMFAAKMESAAPSPEAEPPVAPAPQIQAAAEPAPQKRGPLTPSEENEIDTQVMP